MKEYKILESLGQGAYAQVYEGERDDEKIALKKIKHCSNGIDCLFEATLCSILEHPSICHAREIYSTDSNMYMVLDKGTTDLSYFTRNKSKPTPLSTIKEWLFSVSQAVYYFHRLGIVHGDLKAANVILYPDNTVKLTDFNLSTKLWSPKDKFRHAVGTHSHCPPEVLAGAWWSLSLDIWSLGCLFYEVAFGNFLIPKQRSVKLPNGSSDKKETRNRYYRSITNWLKGIRYDNEPFIPVDIVEDFNSAEYSDFKDLVMKMVRYDSDERITISQVLDHRFFTGCKRDPLVLKETNYTPIIGKSLNRIEKKIDHIMSVSVRSSGSNISQVEITKKLAVSIYQRCQEMIDSENEDLTLVTCCWIGSKLVTRSVPRIKANFTLTEIVKHENEICHHLSYIFPIIDNRSIKGF